MPYEKSDHLKLYEKGLKIIPITSKMHRFVPYFVVLKEIMCVTFPGSMIEIGRKLAKLGGFLLFCKRSLHSFHFQLILVVL